MKPTLLILAAGMGSRYGGLKQMDPLGPQGETMIDYSLFDALRAGFKKAVFVIRPDFAAAFKATLGRRFEKVIEVAYAYQELQALPEGYSPPLNRQKPWGTGHAIWCARKAIQDPFAVINADDFYGAHSYQVMADWLKQQSDLEALKWSMVAYTLRQTLSKHGTVSRGLCKTNPDDHLLSVEECTSIAKLDQGAVYQLNGKDQHLSGDEAVSMNFWGFTPAIFDQLEKDLKLFLKEHGSEEKSELYIPSVVDACIQNGKAEVKVLRSSSTWFGVTYPQDKPLVQEAMLQLKEKGEYPDHLWD